MSFQDLIDRLEEATTTKTAAQQFVDRVVESAESEFTDIGEESRQRSAEEATLNEERSKLNLELKSIKNYRATSARARKANETNSQKRSVIRQKIQRIDVRLGEIERERSGSKM